MQGGWDEGILVITAYRVCHTASDNPGPNTAYTQQYTAMREEGIKKPNPRRQIFTDLIKFIDEKCLEGYRPVVMVDVNGDYNHNKDPDYDLQRFLEDTHLVDYFHEKFPEPSCMSTFGTKRLDYIFVDPALVGAIVRVGYLSSHKRARSDHVLAYIDFEERLLFRGIINRPVDIHSREFMIEQTDKTKQFQKETEKAVKENKIKEKVFKMAVSFARRGRTKRNVVMYQKLDEQIKNMARGTAAKVGKKKYGYMRNRDLTLAGQMLILYKMMLDCKDRQAPPIAALIKRVQALQVDLTRFREISRRIKDLRVEVRKRGADLWKTQKGCKEGWMEWLKTEAKAQSVAAGDKDWEKGLKQMLQIAESRAINRKLGVITKGQRGAALDRIEVPTHDWFHSKKSNKIYHYHSGNFEAHLDTESGTFFPHHSLKVPPDDITQVIVRKEDSGQWRVNIILNGST